jgi:hypothetical protein
MVSRRVVISPVLWSVSVFRVSTSADQERVIRAFQRVNRPGVRATGAHSDRGYFVVLDCERMVDGLHARRLVRAIDRRATRSTAGKDDNSGLGAGSALPAVLQMIRRGGR